MEPGINSLPALLATDVKYYFQQMVEQYQHKLYAFAYRLTDSQHDAEDIVQEAFVRAYIALVTYPMERIYTIKLQAWLYRITLNEFHHYTRRAHLHIVPINLSEDSSIIDIEDPDTNSPALLIENQEQAQELEKLMMSLPEHYRIPLTCYYFEQLSYAEIADLLEQPLGTVKSNISRGVKLLRTSLQLQRGRREA